MEEEVSVPPREASMDIVSARYARALDVELLHLFFHMGVELSFLNGSHGTGSSK
jgi:hypothetical protein